MGRPVRRRTRRGAGPAVGERPVRLAAGAVRPRRLPGARAGAGRRRACSTATNWAAMLAALDDLEAACASRRVPRRPSTTRTCTPRSSAACSNGSARLGGKLRAGRSRNDQVATDLRLYLRDHARGVASRRGRTGRRAGRAGRAHVDTPAPGHDPPAARPAGAPSGTSCSPTSSRCCGTWTGCATGTGGPRSHRSARARWPARRCRWTRCRSPTELGFARRGAELDRRGRRPRLRRRVPVRGRDDRRAPVAAGRGGRALDARREFGWVELDDAVRHRLVDHAAEEESGHRRTGPGQVRPADRRRWSRC